MARETFMFAATPAELQPCFRFLLRLVFSVPRSQGRRSSTSATPCSPVTDLLNPNTSGGPTERIFASAEAGGLSSGCSAGGCIFNFKSTPWAASTVYTMGQQVLDNHFQIQVAVSITGISGATVPTWATTAGSVTTDGTVIWVDQGVQSALTPGAWVHTHPYTKGSKIFDSGGNIQLVTTGGTSGCSMPTFNADSGRYHARRRRKQSNVDERGRDRNRCHGCGWRDEWHHRRQYCGRGNSGGRFPGILLHFERSVLWNVRHRRVRSAGLAADVTVASAQSPPNRLLA